MAATPDLGRWPHRPYRNAGKIGQIRPTVTPCCNQLGTGGIHTVSMAMMVVAQKCILLVLGLAQVALAQQSASSPRIICTQPTTKIVKMVRPKISPDAKNIFGQVSVRAEIDKTGKPSSVKILSGHPILAAAVLAAVRQWRWKPLRLNGEAVEAETTITVNFEPK